MRKDTYIRVNSYLELLRVILVLFILGITMVFSTSIVNTSFITANEGYKSETELIDNNKEEKPVKSKSKIEEPEVNEVLVKEGIDTSKLSLTSDYGDDNPYTKTYSDKSSNLKVSVISSLPMTLGNGTDINASWEHILLDIYKARTNTFDCLVNNSNITIIVTQDQFDGKKAGDKLSYEPQIYIGEKEYKCSPPSLLTTDPYNPNYTGNVLEWDYTVCKRHLRLIEGKILGRWVFESSPKDDIKIVYNQNGNFTLDLAYQGNTSDIEYITPQEFQDMAKLRMPVVIGDTMTFYPSPGDPGANSWDSHISRQGVNEPWATIRGAAAATFTAQTADEMSAYFEVSGTNNQWAVLQRSGIGFYTANLTASANILSATLSLRGAQSWNTLGASPYYNVYTFTPSSNSSVAVGDYNKGGTTGLSIPKAHSNITTTGYNNWELNASGIAHIKTTSVSWFMFKEENYDANNTAPPWVAGKYTGVSVNQADKGTGFQPRLVVIYTLGAISLPTVTTGSATSIEETTTTLNGNITATGGENLDKVGFAWDTASRAEPSNTTAPCNSTYTYCWESGGGGNYTTGNLTHPINTNPGTFYYFRAAGNNSAGWAWGNESTFLTKPNEPANATVTSYGSSWIAYSWDKGSGAGNTTWRYGNGTDCPGNYTLGASSYYGTNTSANTTGLSPGSQYCFIGWSQKGMGGLIQYSDGNDTFSGNTRPNNITNFTATPGAGNITLDWSLATGANVTLILGKQGSYPANATDSTATVVYNSTANTTVHTGLGDNELWCYRAWGNDTDIGYLSLNPAGVCATTPRVSPAVRTHTATLVEETTATFNGEVTNIGAANITLRGFVWDTSSHADPGNTTPPATYGANQTEAGNWGAGNFSHNATGLTIGDLYYLRGYAYNGFEWSYGNETAFILKPGNVTGLVVTATTTNSISLTWTEGDGAANTIIRYNTGSYPATRTSGNSAYDGAGNVTTVNGLLASTTYYFRAWAESAEAGYTNYSDGYSQVTGVTAAGGNGTLYIPAEMSTGIAIFGWASLSAIALVLMILGWYFSTPVFHLFAALFWFGNTIFCWSARINTWDFWGVMAILCLLMTLAALLGPWWIKRYQPEPVIEPKPEYDELNWAEKHEEWRKKSGLKDRRHDREDEF